MDSVDCGVAEVAHLKLQASSPRTAALECENTHLRTQVAQLQAHTAALASENDQRKAENTRLKAILTLPGLASR